MIVCCCYDTLRYVLSRAVKGVRPRLPPCCYVFLTDAPLKPAMILQLSCRSPRIQQDLTYVDLLANDDIHLVCSQLSSCYLGPWAVTTGR